MIDRAYVARRFSGSTWDGKPADLDAWEEIMERGGFDWAWVLGWINAGYPKPMRWLVRAVEVHSPCTSRNEKAPCP